LGYRTGGRIRRPAGGASTRMGSNTDNQRHGRGTGV